MKRSLDEQADYEGVSTQETLLISTHFQPLLIEHKKQNSPSFDLTSQPTSISLRNEHTVEMNPNILTF